MVICHHFFTLNIESHRKIKLNTFSKLYTKFFIKSSKLYISFLLTGLLFVLFITINTNVSIIKTYDGIYAENRILINEIVAQDLDEIYIYKNREENIHHCSVKKVDYFDDIYTIVYVDIDNIRYSYEGVLKIDVAAGKTNLLEIILGIQKRYI